MRNGARSTSSTRAAPTSAQWADAGSGSTSARDIALANAIAREIIHAGLDNREFIDRATTGFEAYGASVEE